MLKKRRRAPLVEMLEARLCMSGPTDFPGSPITLPTDGAWRQTPFLGSPIFADLNNDGRDELITPEAGGKLVAYTFDASGKISLFQTYSTGSEANFKTTPVVLDNPDGGKMLIGALGRDESQEYSLEDGRVFAFNALTGAVLPNWPQNTDRPPPDARHSSGVTGAIATGDLTGDGVPEIVVTSFSTMVTAFKLDGTKLWSFANDETVEPGAVIGDLDRDGKNEVVYASGISASQFYPNGGMITILNDNGSLKRRIFTDEVFFGSPILADIQGNGNLDIVAAGGTYFNTPGGNRVYAWDSMGNLLPGWPYHTTSNDSSAHQVWKDPAAADLNGDGRPEVMVIDRSGRLHVIEPDGTALKGFEGGKAINPPITGQQYNDAFSSPIVADVNGDGKQEIIVAHKFRIVAFDTSGNEVWSASPPVTPGASIPESIDTAGAVGQFDGRGGLELAFLSNSSNTPNPPRSLSVFSLPSSNAAPLWAMNRRDAQGHAIMPSQAFVNGYVNGAYETLLHHGPTNSQRNDGIRALMNNQQTLFGFAQSVVNQGGGQAIWGGGFGGDVSTASLQDRFGPIYAATTGNATIPADSLAAMLFDAHRNGTGTDLAARSYASGGNYAATEFLAGWIRSVFRDVFQREARPAETAGLLKILDDGSLTPGQIVQFLYNTPEARTLYVKEQVKHYLGRDATPQDINSYLFYIHREDVIVAIVSGPEYYQRAGGTLDGLVRAAYRDILGVQNPQPTDVQFWVGQLSSTVAPPRRGRRPAPNPTPDATPASFARALTTNPFFRDTLIVNALMQFTPDPTRGVLRLPLGLTGNAINPDPGIVAAYTNALAVGYSQTDVYASLMTSFSYYFSSSYNRGTFTGWGVRR